MRLLARVPNHSAIIELLSNASNQRVREIFQNPNLSDSSAKAMRQTIKNAMNHLQNPRPSELRSYESIFRKAEVPNPQQVRTLQGSAERLRLWNQSQNPQWNTPTPTPSPTPTPTPNQPMGREQVYERIFMPFPYMQPAELYITPSETHFNYESSELAMDRDQVREWLDHLNQNIETLCRQRGITRLRFILSYETSGSQGSGQFHTSTKFVDVSTALIELNRLVYDMLHATTDSGRGRNGSPKSLDEYNQMIREMEEESLLDEYIFDFLESIIIWVQE